MTPLSAVATELLALARDGRPRPAITFVLDLLPGTF